MMHKKSEVKRMDDAATLAKKAHVKIEKSHRVRDDDARQRAAQERKRIAAGVDMLKEIYARRQAEKKW